MIPSSPLDNQLTLVPLRFKHPLELRGESERERERGGRSSRYTIKLIVIVVALPLLGYYFSTNVKGPTQKLPVSPF